MYIRLSGSLAIASIISTLAPSILAVPVPERESERWFASLSPEDQQLVWREFLRIHDPSDHPDRDYREDPGQSLRDRESEYQGDVGNEGEKEKVYYLDPEDEPVDRYDSELQDADNVDTYNPDFQYRNEIQHGIEPIDKDSGDKHAFAKSVIEPADMKQRIPGDRRPLTKSSRHHPHERQINGLDTSEEDANISKDANNIERKLQQDAGMKRFKARIANRATQRRGHRSFPEDRKIIDVDPGNNFEAFVRDLENKENRDQFMNHFDYLDKYNDEKDLEKLGDGEYRDKEISAPKKELSNSLEDDRDYVDKLEKIIRL